ncbi:hypothetical protein SNE40_001696 [Patella caerulea]|uniref:Uncharacterized protein n=1 Tax=Patella caerulea TaxID=87958 RepID=A0AAN8QDH9_PATCE
MAEKDGAKYNRRIDRSLDQLSPHLTLENKKAISNMRHMTENIRRRFDRLNNDLDDREKALEVEKTLRKNAEDKLKSQLVNMYQNAEVNTELRTRLPRANKSDPFDKNTENQDLKEVNIQTSLVDVDGTDANMDDKSSVDKFNGKLKKKTRRRRRLNFEYPYDKYVQRGDQYCSSSDMSDEEADDKKARKQPRNHPGRRYSDGHYAQTNPIPLPSQPFQLNGYNQHWSKEPLLQNSPAYQQHLLTYQQDSLRPNMASSHPQVPSANQTVPSANHLYSNPDAQPATALSKTDHDLMKQPLRSLPVAQSTPFHHYSHSYDSGFVPSYGYAHPSTTSLTSHQTRRFSDGNLSRDYHDIPRPFSPTYTNQSGGFTPNGYETAHSELKPSSGRKSPLIPFSNYVSQENSPASYHTALSDSCTVPNKIREPSPTVTHQNQAIPRTSRSYEDVRGYHDYHPVGPAVVVRNEEFKKIPEDEAWRWKMEQIAKEHESSFYETKMKSEKEIESAMTDCLHILQQRQQTWQQDHIRSTQNTSLDEIITGNYSTQTDDDDSFLLDLSSELPGSTSNYLSSKEAMEEFHNFLRLFKKKKEHKERIIKSEMQVIINQRDYAVNKMQRMKQDMLISRSRTYDANKDDNSTETTIYNNNLFEDFNNLRINHSMMKYMNLPDDDSDQLDAYRLSPLHSSPAHVTQDENRTMREMRGLVVKLDEAYAAQDQQQKKIQQLEKLVSVMRRKGVEMETPSRDKD